MNRIWCFLLFLSTWPMARKPIKDQQCYVPVCGVYGPETTSDCPFLVLNTSSGSWQTSWAKHASARPTEICSPKQLDTFLMIFPILETPVKQLGLTTTKDGDSTHARGAVHQLTHRLQHCANWVIALVPEEWRPSPHLLFWFAVVTFFRIVLSFLGYKASTGKMSPSTGRMRRSVMTIFYWPRVGLSALFWWVRGKSGQNHERLEAESVKIQELQERVRVLEGEKGCLELRAGSLERKVEDQLTLQRSLDCENNDKESKVKELIRSQRREIEELEQDLEQSENLFKAEMMCHSQQTQEILMHVRKAEQKLEVERKESGILRQNLIDVSAQLEEMKRPVREGETMLENRKAQTRERHNLEMKNKRALGRLQDVRGQWQRKDQALQQKVAELESERRDKEVKVKALLRSHKLKVQEIEEKHLRTELSYEAEIESLKKLSQENWDTSERELTACKKERNALRKQLDEVSAELQGALFGSTSGHSHQQITTSTETNFIATETEFSGSSDESVEASSAAERETHLYLERLWAEQWKTQDLEGKVQALEQDRDALEDENCQLEHQTSALQGRVRNMADLCQQKEQTLQHFLRRTLSTIGLRMQRMSVQEPRLSPVSEIPGSCSEEDL